MISANLSLNRTLCTAEQRRRRRPGWMLLKQRSTMPLPCFGSVLVSSLCLMIALLAVWPVSSPCGILKGLAYLRGFVYLWGFVCYGSPAALWASSVLPWTLTCLNARSLDRRCSWYCESFDWILFLAQPLLDFFSFNSLLKDSDCWVSCITGMSWQYVSFRQRLSEAADQPERSYFLWLRLQ